MMIIISSSTSTSLSSSPLHIFISILQVLTYKHHHLSHSFRPYICIRPITICYHYHRHFCPRNPQELSLASNHLRISMSVSIHLSNIAIYNLTEIMLFNAQRTISIIVVFINGLILILGYISSLVGPHP